MRDAKYRFVINGEVVNDPTESQDIQVLSTFANGGVQDILSTSTLKFALDSKKLIDQYVKDGVAGGLGIYEGMELDVYAENGNQSDLLGEFLIDFETYNVTEFDTEVSFGYRRGLERIADRSNAISFGWLEEQGIITDADFEEIKYRVRPPFQPFEIATMLIVLYSAYKSIADILEKPQTATNIASGDAAGSPAGGIGAAVFTALQVIVIAAYVAAILLAVVSTLKRIFDLLVPINRTANAMTFRTMLEKVCEYLGYELDTNINLENYLHIPSTNTAQNINPVTGAILNGRRNQSGIPVNGDYCYPVPQFLDLIKRMFYAKFAIIDNRFVFRNINDDYWITNSSFKLRADTYDENFTLNNNELKGRRILSFATDRTDTYTIEEFKGTNYEIITRPIRIGNEENITLKGYESIDFPVALGTTASGSAFNSLIRFTAGILDNLLNTLGQSSDLRGRLSNVNDILVVSDYAFTTAKVVYWENGRIPADHREKLSAKALYEDYYQKDSFVNEGQKKLFTGVRIPFNFENWLQVKDNAYFTDNLGRECKLQQLQWSLLSDYATIDYWRREKFTTNLREEYIEA